jgi:hypothetical protein
MSDAPKDLEELATPDEERRAALEKLGKLAAFTPPTLLTLLLSERATAQSLGPPPPPP